MWLSMAWMRCLPFCGEWWFVWLHAGHCQELYFCPSQLALEHLVCLHSYVCSEPAKILSITWKHSVLNTMQAMQKLAMLVWEYWSPWHVADNEALMGTFGMAAGVCVCLEKHNWEPVSSVGERTAVADGSNPRQRVCKEAKDGAVVAIWCPCQPDTRHPHNLRKHCHFREANRHGAIGGPAPQSPARSAMPWVLLAALKRPLPLFFPLYPSACHSIYCTDLTQQQALQVFVGTVSGPVNSLWNVCGCCDCWCASLTLLLVQFGPTGALLAPLISPCPDLVEFLPFQTAFSHRPCAWRAPRILACSRWHRATCDPLLRALAEPAGQALHCHRVGRNLYSQSRSTGVILPLSQFENVSALAGRLLCILMGERIRDSCMRDRWRECCCYCWNPKPIFGADR